MVRKEMFNITRKNKLLGNKLLYHYCKYIFSKTFYKCRLQVTYSRLNRICHRNAYFRPRKVEYDHRKICMFRWVLLPPRLRSVLPHRPFMNRSTRIWKRRVDVNIKTWISHPRLEAKIQPRPYRNVQGRAPLTRK